MRGRRGPPFARIGTRLIGRDDECTVAGSKRENLVSSEATGGDSLSLANAICDGGKGVVKFGGEGRVLSWKDCGQRPFARGGDRSSD